MQSGWRLAHILLTQVNVFKFSVKKEKNQEAFCLVPNFTFPLSSVAPDDVRTFAKLSGFQHL